MLLGEAFFCEHLNVVGHTGVRVRCDGAVGVVDDGTVLVNKAVVGGHGCCLCWIYRYRLIQLSSL